VRKKKKGREENEDESLVFSVSLFLVDGFLMPEGRGD
jgi:hypothetical protein